MSHRQEEVVNTSDSPDRKKFRRLPLENENLENENKERWRELCKRASVEQDPDKFISIIRELNEVLEEKELRLNKVQNLSGADRLNLP